MFESSWRKLVRAWYRCATCEMGLLLALLVQPSLASAQAPDSTRGHAGWWAGGVALVASAALDNSLREEAVEFRRPVLDRWAEAGTAIGAGHNIEPVLLLSFAGGLLTGSGHWERATLRAAAAYVAGNLAVGGIKGIVGRHRPGATGPWTFRPFTTRGSEWHSFPSAHAVHAFSLAAVVAGEAHTPWVSVPAYAVAGLVGWSRVYNDVHWTSDVVAGALLGLGVGRGVEWVAERGRRAGHSPLLRLAGLPEGEGFVLELELPVPPEAERRR